MNRGSQYDRYVSTHYHHIAPATIESYRRRYYVWRSYIRKFLPPSKDSSILEIGCGVGHNLYALKELGYFRVVGTDYSSQCVDICRKQGFVGYLVDEKTEKTFYRKHVNRFDCIILYDLVEHYEPKDARDMLESVRAMLHPKGSVIISLPNANHPFSNTLLFADITHKFIYNPVSLSQLLRSSGFQNISYIQMNSWSTYDDNLIRRIFKSTILRWIGILGELFWRGMALSQGIVLTECKPTLVARATYD